LQDQDVDYYAIRASLYR